MSVHEEPHTIIVGASLEVSREQVLARAQPFPTQGEMAVADLTDDDDDDEEEEEAFLAAIADT
ncbi:MAG: hypothetical protein ACT4OX_08320 [Actinomycetota bacterium]